MYLNPLRNKFPADTAVSTDEMRSTEPISDNDTVVVLVASAVRFML